MSEFKEGDLVCIDGEPVIAMQVTIDAGLFDIARFPDTRRATDEEEYQEFLLRKNVANDPEFTSAELRDKMTAKLNAVGKRIATMVGEPFVPCTFRPQAKTCECPAIECMCLRDSVAVPPSLATMLCDETSLHDQTRGVNVEQNI